jgi:membrane-bound lytic murein transglycosylase B
MAASGTFGGVKAILGKRRLATVLIGGIAALALAACETSKPAASTGTKPKPTASSTPVPNPGSGAKPAPSTPTSTIAFKTSGDPSFDKWRSGFAGKAEAAGQKKATITAVLDGLTPLPQETVKVAFDQPEFTKPIWDYVKTRTSPTYINNGQSKMAANKPVFDAIGSDYATPPEIIAAIWGMETSYGSYIGDIDAPRAIATQAALGNRVPFYEGELIAIMKLIDAGSASRDQFKKGSWAGALGQTQFMPSTLVGYAKDFDKDGKEDVWTNPGDALASAANYMSQVGWKKGQPWGVEVAIPAGFDYSLGDGSKKSVADWKALGLTASNVTPMGADSLMAELFLPAGSYGPAFLLYSNFDVIKKYNNSDSYALAVGLLAERLAGRPDVVKPWPTNIKLLTQSQVTDLQKSLTKLGYDTKGSDGVIGRNTRKALQLFQKDHGLMADGFATTEVLDKVKAAGG